MEVKVNREIRIYRKHVFGLSMWQFVFGHGLWDGRWLYFFYCGLTGMKLSWACIAAAAPFWGVRPLSYHGMSAEQFCGHG